MDFSKRFRSWEDCVLIIYADHRVPIVKTAIEYLGSEDQELRILGREILRQNSTEPIQGLGDKKQIKKQKYKKDEKSKKSKN